MDAACYSRVPDPVSGQDGDGDLDAVIGNNNEASELLLNDGLGGFTASTSFPGGNANSIALGDVGVPI